MAPAVKFKKVASKGTVENNSDSDIHLIYCTRHSFNSHEIEEFRSQLLKWYDTHQRKLPWRDIAREEQDLDRCGYAVWVSEIMLQQTQVSTVVPYFEKWIKKWPSIPDLASSNLEDVNKVWAGLGYYSRAKRLYEGACLLMENRNGHMPRTPQDLKGIIPGIGRYTASAISSIAYQHVTGVVDGNVSRVFSRVRAIGGDITKPPAQTHLWKLADDIVSLSRPGDFNQALMELGAVICTPRNPKCNDCPVRKLCLVNAMSESVNQKVDGMMKNRNLLKNSTVCDIEEVSDCQLCMPKDVWKANPTVSTFPYKPKKKSPREEIITVVVVESNRQLLMVQRSETGLLAGLWEFPSIPLNETTKVKNKNDGMVEYLVKLGLPRNIGTEFRQNIGEVLHIFSHIRTTYVVEYLVLKNDQKIKSNSEKAKWIKREDIEGSAISTAMKKVLQAVDNFLGESKTMVPCSKKRKIAGKDEKQKSIKSFLASKK